MKSKEEIEQLAEKKFNVTYHPYSRQGFIDGYTQCQLDMAKELEIVDIICPKCQGINEYFIENGDYKCAYTDCEHKFNQLNKTKH